MSIPTSKILKASKAVMAIADLKNNSPNAAQSQNVNVFVNTPQPTEPDQTVNYQTQENPYTV